MKWLFIKSLNLWLPKYGRPDKESWWQLKQYIYTRDRGRCQKCGCEVRLLESHCHHIQPVSEDGSNHPQNLETVCIECHKKIHPWMRQNSG